MMCGYSQCNLNNEISGTVVCGEEIDSRVVINSITCYIYNQLGIKLLVIEKNIIIVNKYKKSMIIEERHYHLHLSFSKNYITKND